MVTQVDPVIKTHNYLNAMSDFFLIHKGSIFIICLVITGGIFLYQAGTYSAVNNLFDNQKTTADQIKNLNLQVSTINDNVKSSSDISKSLIEPMKAVLEGQNILSKSILALGDFQVKIKELLTINIDTVTKINDLLSTHVTDIVSMNNELNNLKTINISLQNADINAQTQIAANTKLIEVLGTIIDQNR